MNKDFPNSGLLLASGVQQQISNVTIPDAWYNTVAVFERQAGYGGVSSYDRLCPRRTVRHGHDVLTLTSVFFTHIHTGTIRPHQKARQYARGQPVDFHQHKANDFNGQHYYGLRRDLELESERLDQRVHQLCLNEMLLSCKVSRIRVCTFFQIIIQEYHPQHLTCGAWWECKETLYRSDSETIF